ncbi:trypsin-like peptidase domain-containing protein [Candidatus Peregrinibacteria bacterium]|nr:trypsin-like peptidase domain-containing protein [Candidatus Peregrinibacteria bacterium]
MIPEKIKQLAQHPNLTKVVESLQVRNMSHRKKITLLSVLLTAVVIFVVVIATYLAVSEMAMKRSLALLNDDDLPIVQIHSFSHYTDSKQLVYEASGSGSLISDNYDILTNFHVISDSSMQKAADTFEVCLTEKVDKPPSCLYTAELVAAEPKKDVALLRLNQRDIFGNELPDDLRIMQPNYEDIAVGEQIYISGYPGIGNETVTFTRGSISGYSENTEGLWIKTDSKVDSGNSGGAVINANIELIGVPTYTVTDTETIAYFKPLQDVRDFIEKGMQLPADKKFAAQKALKEQMKLNEKAKKSSTYTHKDPNFSIKLQPGWHFSYIDDGIYIENDNMTYTMEISMRHFPYEISADAYKKWIEAILADGNYVYKIFPEANIAGQKAYGYSYAGISSIGDGYFFAKGNYGIDVYVNADQTLTLDFNYEDYAKKADELTKMIQSISFGEQFVYTAPASFQSNGGYATKYSISSIPNWYIQTYLGDNGSIDLFRKDSTAYISINNYYMSDQEFLAPDQNFKNSILDLETSYSGVKILEENYEYMVNGKPLYKVVYEFRKGRNLYKEMYLKYIDWNNENALNFIYSTTADEYEKHLPEAMTLLGNWRIE